MQQQRAYNIAVQLLFWLFFLGLPVLFVVYQPNGQVNTGLLLRPASWVYLLFYPACFYFHHFVAWPRLYCAKKQGLYVLFVLALLLLALWLKPFENMQHAQESQGNFPPGPPPANLPGGPPRRGGPHFDIISLVLMICILAIDIAWQLARQWRQTEQRALEAEAEKSKAELSFLKAQVNPHFLFNTLNNLYYMAQSGNAQTADGIMHLSNIMRYVTDEASLEQVALDDELDCIENFIELQRLRLGKQAQLETTLLNKMPNVQIAPLILLPLVENVFKHGISNHELSPLFISIVADTDGKLTLHTSNRKFANRKIESRTGLGISNTRKRLEQLYPNQFVLSTREADNSFEVNLTIQLGKNLHSSTENTA